MRRVRAAGSTRGEPRDGVVSFRRPACVEGSSLVFFFFAWGFRAARPKPKKGRHIASLSRLAPRRASRGASGGAGRERPAKDVRVEGRGSLSSWPATRSIQVTPVVRRRGTITCHRRVTVMMSPSCHRRVTVVRRPGTITSAPPTTAARASSGARLAPLWFRRRRWRLLSSP